MGTKSEKSDEEKAAEEIFGFMRGSVAASEGFDFTVRASDEQWNAEKQPPLDPIFDLRRSGKSAISKGRKR